MDFAFKAGSVPLLISMPHVGTAVPDDIAARLTPQALALPDTDWHLAQLYGFADTLGASILAAHWSRYVIDLNRPPDDTSLYPGLDSTGLCPLDTFARAPLYLDGKGPDEQDVCGRVTRYWTPYHRQLRAELDRLLTLHGKVVLWDAHSIASEVPRLFDGRLPDLNFGSAGGTSCAAGLEQQLVGMARRQQRWSVALNGRFKGGHITRHYGQPHLNVHAIQLEMCQVLYMDEQPPFSYHNDLAGAVQPLLGELAACALAWVRAWESA